MLGILHQLPFISILIGVDVHPMAMHLTITPLAIIHTPIRIQVLATTMHLILQPYISGDDDQEERGIRRRRRRKRGGVVVSFSEHRKDRGPRKEEYRLQLLLLRLLLLLSLYSPLSLILLSYLPVFGHVQHEPLPLSLIIPPLSFITITIMTDVDALPYSSR